MTIRRQLDISNINSDYQYLLSAAEHDAALNERTTATDIMELIGTAIDGFLSEARALGLSVCNADRSREIECLMFDMLLAKNPDGAIAEAIKRGERIEEAEEEEWVRQHEAEREQRLTQVQQEYQARA